MPVSGFSHLVSSARGDKLRTATANGVNHGFRENAELVADNISPSPGIAGPTLDTAHIANLRALSRGKIKGSCSERGREEKVNDGQHLLKTSHESVGLLTPRIARSESTERRRALVFGSRRNSTMGAETGADETQPAAKTGYTALPPGHSLQDNLVTPFVDHGQFVKPQTLGDFSWAREADRKLSQCGSKSVNSSRLSLGSKMTFSCPKPANRTNSKEIMKTIASGYENQTDVKAACRVRKTPFNEELETVCEEGRQGTRIMVYVRLRPMSKKEKEAGARSCVKVVNKRDLYLTEFALETDYLRLKRLKGRHFAFDAAFPDNTTQNEVYNTSTAELVEGVLQGRNGSVFCYGATGAGKTHTMLGTVQNPGVMVLALKDLFTKLRQRSREGDFVVRLSYLEVYNESVRDLLSPGRPLVLREDSKQGIVAAGLTQYEAYSAAEVMSLLQQGNQNRTTEPTRVNETSSRSHAILQVLAEYKLQQDSGLITRVGKLSLIDLAGSERALATDQRTLRSLEGANINRSLLALSSCINALVEGKKHIPFRNSKLTQLLKDSLGGACQTAMIANISPGNLSFGETQNTLHWADRAKEIRTKVCTANEELQILESESEQAKQAKLLLEVRKENQQLRLQLTQLQQKLLTVQNTAVSQSPPVFCNVDASSSSPFTPTKTANPVECQMCSLESHAPGVVQRDAERSAELRLIQELQSTVQSLENDREQIRQEAAMREEKLTASIATLNHEHGMQLKHKDNVIRILCQKIIPESTGPTPPSSSLPIECLQQASVSDQQVKVVPKVSESGRATPTTRKLNRVAIPATGRCNSGMIDSATPMGLDGPRKPAAAPSTKPCFPPQPSSTHIFHIPDSEQRTRTGRLSRRSSHYPPATPLPRFCSPSKELTSSGQKRTFWDITNANSPSAHTGRCTRSNTATTPSMLLQPGFLRGRPSLN
eukprot:c29589_g1_i1 orf=91-2919(+)